MSLSDSSAGSLKNQTCSSANNTSYSTIRGLYGSSFSLWLYYRLQENPYQSHIILTADKTESQRILREISALFSSQKKGSQIEGSQIEGSQVKTSRLKNTNSQNLTNPRKFIFPLLLI